MINGWCWRKVLHDKTRRNLTSAHLITAKRIYKNHCFILLTFITAKNNSKLTLISYEILNYKGYPEFFLKYFTGFIHV